MERAQPVGVQAYCWERARCAHCVVAKAIEKDPTRGFGLRGRGFWGDTISQ